MALHTPRETYAWSMRGEVCLRYLIKIMYNWNQNIQVWPSSPAWQYYLQEFSVLRNRIFANCQHPLICILFIFYRKNCFQLRSHICSSPCFCCSYSHLSGHAEYQRLLLRSIQREFSVKYPSQQTSPSQHVKSWLAYIRHLLSLHSKLQLSLYRTTNMVVWAVSFVLYELFYL